MLEVADIDQVKEVRGNIQDMEEKVVNAFQEKILHSELLIFSDAALAKFLECIGL